MAKKNGKTKLWIAIIFIATSVYIFSPADAMPFIEWDDGFVGMAAGYVINELKKK